MYLTFLIWVIKIFISMNNILVNILNTHLTSYILTHTSYILHHLTS